MCVHLIVVVHAGEILPTWVQSNLYKSLQDTSQLNCYLVELSAQQGQINISYHKTTSIIKC